jgi:hypothetical protein
VNKSHSAETGARRTRISRGEFDRLDPVERAALMKQGCTLFDEPKPKRQVVLRPGQMLRSDFEQLDNTERMFRILGGIQLVD